MADWSINGTYHESRNKPDDRRQEAECLSNLPARAQGMAAAPIAEVSEVPVPDAAARDLLDGVHKDTKGSEPSEGDEHIHWIQC